MSSRNVYLSPEQRAAALVLPRSLRLAERLFAEGERDAGIIRSLMVAMINAEPMASLDYVSIADAESLEELGVIDRPALVSLAVRFGPTRLIDNMTLTR
jgi:pantoate--beta-alanine ligase